MTNDMDLSPLSIFTLGNYFHFINYFDKFLNKQHH